MQAQLQQWKRQRDSDAVRCEAPIVLREGLRLSIAAHRPERIRSAMAALTFQPLAGFDRAVPPAQVLCYHVECEDTLVVPRCFGGLSLAGPALDRLSSGDVARGLAFQGSLNELQETAAGLTLKKLSALPHAAVLTLPCGYGKTVVALSVAAALGRKTLVVVHKDFLMQQWLQRIAQFLPAAKTGVIQGPKASWEEADVCVAMLQTLCARDMPEGCLDSFGTVLLDEAHHLGAPYFSRLFFRLPSRYLLGLTATPRRKDGCSEILHLFMGDFSFQLKARPPDGVVVLVRRWPSASGVRTGELSNGEIQRLKGRLVKDERRNDFIVRSCLSAAATGRQVLCLSERLQHLRDLRAKFEASTGGREVSCAFYVGGAGKANLQERSSAETAARVIFATYAMAAEALDIPRLDTLVLATPISDATQSVGRVLRPCESKQAPVVLDIVDDGCSSFLRQAGIRRGLYDRSAFSVEELGDEAAPAFEAARYGPLLGKKGQQ